ncbi:MAG TPA: tyrosine-type recombinase/integrase [Armatimonadota bacterium]|nr:tyrosine-type recombinase/integrase [Armatimonadota bacterium]
MRELLVAAEELREMCIAAGAPVGPQWLAEIRRAVSAPLVAVGGISVANVAKVMRADADAAAVVSAVSRADDMVAAAQAGQVGGREVESRRQTRCLLTDSLDALEGRSPDSVRSYRRDLEPLLAEPQVETPTGVRDLALLAFLYNTGLRVAELCALNRADVQLPADGWGQVQLVGKGMRLRWVPINSHARRTLEDYLAQRQDDNPALFLNRSGERFSVRGVALLVNRYLRRIGITDRSGPHLLRHTFAAHALRSRPKLRAVQELLGHSSVTTTQRYTHMDAEDLRRQVARLPANRFRL